MNSKATKQTIVWPPLLQMGEEDHKVDTTFQNWEKFNAPIVNERIQNLWTQDLERNDVIFSRKGDKFNLDSEGYLCKNDTRLVGSPQYTRSVVKTELEFLKGADDVAKDNEGNYYFIKNNVLYYNSSNTVLANIGTGHTVHFVQGQNTNYMFVIEGWLTKIPGTTTTSGVTWTNWIIRVYSSGSLVRENSRGYDAGNMQVPMEQHTSANQSSLIVVSKEDAIKDGKDLTIQGYAIGDIINFCFMGHNSSISPSENCSFIRFAYNASTDESSASRMSASTPYPSTGDLYTSVYSTFNWSESTINGKCIKVNDYWYNLSSGISSVSQVTSVTPLFFPSTYTPNSKVGNVILTNDSGQATKYDVFSYTIYRMTKTFQLYNTDEMLNQFWNTPTGFASISSDASYNSIKFDGINKTWTFNGQSFSLYLTQGKYERMTNEYGTEYGAITADMTRGVQTISYTITSTAKVGVGVNGGICDKDIGTIYYKIDVGNRVTIPKQYHDGVTPFRYKSGYTGYETAGTFAPPEVCNDYGTWMDFSTIYASTLNSMSTNNTSYADICQASRPGRVFTTSELTNSWSTYPFNPTSVSIATKRPRTKSFAINGPYLAITMKVCNDYATAPIAMNNGVSESRYGLYSEFVSTNGWKGTKYCPGTTRSNSFNHLSYALLGLRNVLGTSEDNLCYTVGGDYISVNSFRLLFNVELSETCNLSGISTSSGVILTPWYSVDKYWVPPQDQDNTILYRDTDNLCWYSVSIRNVKPSLKGIMNNRYILVPNPDYTLMLYDTDRDEFFDYAVDYNDRYNFGLDSYANFKGTLSTGSKDVVMSYIKYTATAMNANYSRTNRPTTSILYPCYPRFRVRIPNTTDLNEQYQVDVYYTVNNNSTTPVYRYTVKNGKQYQDTDLAEASYPFTTSSSNILPTNLFTEYVDQAGNNDLAKEDEYTTYTLNYLDNNPVFNYSALTRVSTGAFTTAKYFVIQGQFFGYYNDKIYALSYSGGVLAAQDPIVDCRGMLFVGNNPEIAFFWSPQNKAFYSFTGDCKLLLIYDGSKFDNVTGKYWYDELGQNIYVDTDEGLLVLGNKNTYLLEDFKNTTDVFVSQDGITHIYANDTIYNLKYYKDEGYKVIPLDLETSFYGLGNTESTSIDRWNITVFDKDHTACTIKVGVRSLTDITVKSEEKTYKITPDMYDEFNHCVLLSYVPKLIKGQGLRLYVKSPINVTSIVPHIMDNQYGTPTRRGL